MKNIIRKHLTRILLKEEKSDDLIWIAEGSNGNRLYIADSREISILPFLTMHCNPKIVIEIPEELNQIVALDAYKEALKIFRNHHRISQNIFDLLRVEYGLEGAHKAIEFWEHWYNDACDFIYSSEQHEMEKNNKLRYLKLPDYSLLRITALRSNPKLEDWKPDQGDRSKMQFDLIPGQTTIVTCSTDGSITDNLPHITPEHKYLLYTLWTKHFEDGEDQDINRISYAEICQRLKRKPSGTEYKRIDKRLLDLKMMTIKINNGKKDYVFGLLDGYTADKVRDSGNRSIEYTLGRIIINGRKRLPFTCHTYLIDRLTIGQRNIIEYLMSHRSEKVSQFGNLEYHTCFEEVKSFSLRRGYLQDDARGNRNIKRFYRDLKDLVERYPRHQDNKEYPGFAYQVKESKGKEIIYLYLCNTRGPQ